MTIKEALEIVCRAAESNANGNLHCKEIIEAIAMLQMYVKEQEDN